MEPNPLYQSLRALAGDRRHGVLTSNVDALFARNGFTTDALYTPQGDYALYQCLTPCTRQVWDSRPILGRILEDYDPRTGTTSEEAVPKCPNCGGKVNLNVYAGSWYINDHFQPDSKPSQSVPFPTQSSGESLTILEIGVLNTPAVVRWPVEELVRQIPSARLVRINPENPGVPDEIGDRAGSLTVAPLEFVARATRR